VYEYKTEIVNCNALPEAQHKFIAQ